jgi:6-pyruvoyltetrahydropterin/6-carboxytetrahydropterin synthase
MEIFRCFNIEAAHRLPNVPPGHKCERLHGHSYRIDVHVRGSVGVDTGWVIDFADIENAFRPVFSKLDHQYLNEVEGLSNPTSENIARWIWGNLKASLPGLIKIVVHETYTSGCVYQGQDSGELIS